MDEYKQSDWWDVVWRVQMGVFIWGTVRLHSMGGWALSGADVQNWKVVRWCRTQASSHNSQGVWGDRWGGYEHCGTKQERSTLQSNGPGLRLLFTELLLQHPNRSQQAASGARRVMSASCKVTQGVGNTWATCPTLLRGIWFGAEGQGFVVVFDFKLTFGFLVVKMEGSRHCFAVLRLSFESGGIHLQLPCPWSAPHPLPASLHQHAWLLDRQHMHTFWRRWLAGQRCRCWRKGAPGQIPVGRHSWGVATCSFVHFRWQGWSCDCQPYPLSGGPYVYHAAIAAACRWGRGAIQCRRLLWGRQTQLQPSF